MTRAQQKSLKGLGLPIVQAAFVLDALVKERAALDREGTEQLIDEIVKTLRKTARGPKQ